MAWPVAFLPVTAPSGKVVMCRNAVRFVGSLAYIRASNNSCEFVIDSKDLPKVAGHRWRENNGYAKCGHNYRTICMAWLLCPRWREGVQVDHINRVRSDNRRSNLRVATPTSNGHNLSMFITNTSGYPGVHFHKHSGLWHAEMAYEIKGVRTKKSGGYFKSLKDACQRSKEMRDARGYYTHPIPAHIK